MSGAAKVPLAEYRRALQFLLPHWPRFLPLIAISLVSTGITVAQPYLTKLLIDDGLTRRNFRSLELFAIWIGVFAALSFGLGILTTLLYTRLSALVLFDMRLAAFKKLQCLSPQFFATTKTGDIVSRLNNDIGELQKLSSDTLLSLPVNLLFLAGNAGMMLYLNIRLFAVSVVMLPVGLWAMRRYQGRLRTQVHTLRQYSADIGSFLIEAILGMRVLVGCNAQDRKNREFEEHNNRFVKSLLDMQITSFLAGAVPGMVITISVAVLFLYGGGLVIRGALTLGGLVAFMAYHGKLLSPVQSLMGSYSALVTGSVSLGRVFELLDAREEVTEKPDAIPATLERGDIEFQNVSFRYRSRDCVLRDVSFSLRRQSICVLVGESGAGKSTIADLLMRFYDPESGKILIDGHDIEDLRLHDLRSAVGLVDQMPFFFHASIRENLQFASCDVSLADCERAISEAGLSDFIESLPERYETVIGERGLTLSAGQRQRLAIARALLRSPAILVLDEPSAALDPRAEFALGETLRRLSARTTILVATHRPALVEIADQVIVLENGCIAETGDPSRLLASRQSSLSQHFRDEFLRRAVTA